MLLHRWRSAPAPLITLADAAITGLWAMVGLRRPRELPERDRTLRLAVEDPEAPDNAWPSPAGRWWRATRTSSR